jgi:hypothetical protein
MPDPAGRPAEGAQSGKPSLRLIWRGWFASFVAIVLLLTAVDVLVFWEDRRLLIPALAALAFFLFMHPTGADRNLRGIVVAPAIGAVIGTLGTIAQTRLPQFIVVLVTVAATMLMMRLLNVAVATVLVVMLLPIVHGSLTEPSRDLQQDTLPIYTYLYPVWISAYTALLFLVFKIWRRTLLED